MRIARSALLVLYALASTAIAGITFAASVSMGYDSYENRLPAERDAIAGTWLIVSLALLLVTTTSSARDDRNASGDSSSRRRH